MYEIRACRYPSICSFFINSLYKGDERITTQDPIIHYFNKYYMEGSEKKTLLYWSPENIRLVDQTVEEIKNMRPHIVVDGHPPFERLAEISEEQHKIFVKWLEIEALKELELKAASKTTIDFLPEKNEAIKKTE